jgi:hypothetical protein
VDYPASLMGILHQREVNGGIPKLCRTGLDLSRICLGCMSYGGGNRGNHAWSLDPMFAE